jgi:hypothetical protein
MQTHPHSYPTDLDEEWNQIKSLVPARKSGKGKTRPAEFHTIATQGMEVRIVLIAQQW